MDRIHGIFSATSTDRVTSCIFKINLSVSSVLSVVKICAFLPRNFPPSPCESNLGCSIAVI